MSDGADLGRRVRAARMAAGLTMTRLADLVGVSQPFISQVERGVASPSLSTLNALALALEVAPGDLMPQPARGEARVTRAADGDIVRTFDDERSARGRVIAPGRGPGLEFIEYVIQPEERVDEWFHFPGEIIVFVIDGELEVEIEEEGIWRLRARDAIHHDAARRHRWRPVGDAPVHLVLAASR